MDRHGASRPKSLSDKVSDMPPLKDPPAKAAALVLMRKGLFSPSDVARHAGVHRDTAYAWCAEAGIDWRKAVKRRQAAQWIAHTRQTSGRGQRKPSKKELSARADKAVAAFNAAQRRARRRQNREPQ
jgi:hypothetical protein